MAASLLLVVVSAPGPAGNSGTLLAGKTTPLPTATASTSAAPSTTAALVDGSVATGRTGNEWTAAPGDASPWVQLSWSTPRRLASVQVFGPTATAVDPAAPWNAPLHGLLRFGDGSTVVVSGISGGGGQATSIAFAPRTTTTVRLELARTVSTATVSLREVAAYEVGTTPPRWPQPAGGYATSSTLAGQCGGTTPPVGRASARQLGLICPAPGSAVSRSATIAVAGPASTPVQATAWVDPPGSMPAAERTVATGVTDGQGRAVLTFATTTLPMGPFAVKVARTGPTAQASDVPLYVQLVNRSGVTQDTRDHAPSGMTLQYAEEFTTPLSVSQRGTGTTYAATKPSHVAGGSFGDAWFADPAESASSLSTLDSQYLRLRVQPSDPATTPWGLEHTGGIVSSLRVGGSGFAAQYGYFEARMLGAPGIGSWPAFWMLDTENATPRGTTAVEVDAVELYGHNTLGSCHTTHNWGYTTGDSGVANCFDRNGFADWALSWHTYGVRFVPGAAVFSIDGVQVASYTGLQQTADPFYFMVDLALGGGWPVDLAATGNVTDLYVDWVHVYT
ncbi:glycoside hydrolase family 16 protein [Modestobacter excelsi]|uniref:glycoside hydrolase family 16 protein n=1 Tax=Modestobacter excelsi TaxID=2213161 RepID=UPI00110D11F3|nr:glycoside hydrolase family 16 protein [Modestobacter excelsi]